MKSSDFNELINETTRARRALYSKKAQDYATDDCLSNFKRMSHMLQMLRVDAHMPEGVCLFFMMVKIDRLCNLLHKQVGPANESLDDTIDDLLNYTDLLRGILKDKELGPKEGI